MGQAQLLLIVLGVVLVGIAIIAGIQAYSTNNVKASIDSQVHDQLRIASDVQTWVQKPAQFGGPATYADFTEVADFAVINYKNADGSAAAATWTNANAVYTMAPGVATGVTVTSTNAQLGTFTDLTICGINDVDIVIGTSAVDLASATADKPACP